jgi:hypothetical protein
MIRPALRRSRQRFPVRRVERSREGHSPEKLADCRHVLASKITDFSKSVTPVTAPAI